MPKRAGDRIGRYIIDRRLGAGGMAEAYLAHQEGPAGFSKPVVVKVLHAQHAVDASMVEMFLREARVGARLNHTNIVQIFDLGEVEGEHFIAMEHVDGMTLQQVARRCWALGHGIPIDVAVRVIAAAAQGLHYAHTLRAPDGTPAGIVHRDISPDNIMIARDGSVKVLDFGVAKLRGSEGTQSGEIKGKIPFMSPEQLDADGDVDGRSDLWALGVTLYWCIAGRRPFSAQSDVLTIRQILEKEPAPLKEVNKAVDSALEEAVMNLLEKDRERRVGNGAKLAQKLLKLVPASHGNPLAKFMERMALFDDDPPEQRFKSPSSISGVPGAPMARDSTEIIRPNETAFAAMLKGDAEDVPSTVRLEREHAERARRSRALVAALAAALVVIVVVGSVLAVFLREKQETSAALPDAGAALALAAVVDAGVEDDEVIDAGQEEEPEPVDAKQAPEKISYRTVQVVAPPHVKWTTMSGKLLGQGSRSLQVPESEQSILAVDSKMDARISMPVAPKIELAKAPKGSLAIRVLPYATNVKIGSLSLGPTPLRNVTLTAGVYRVIVEKDGKSVAKMVRVKPEKDGDSLLTVDLRK